MREVLARLAETGGEGMTRADSIRNMSDEALADWIDSHFASAAWCRDDAPVDPETKNCLIWDCKKCVLEWLKAEGEM